MIDPLARADTQSSAFDITPCGGASKGPSHSLIDPDSYHPITWTVFHASEGANCTVRLLNADLTFTPLKAINAKADPSGWFPCARKEAKYESVSVLIPKDPKCSECVVQFICKTYQGSLYQCSDLQISALPMQTCKDQCKNGGKCSGNMCTCKKNFAGVYCELAIDN